MKEFSIKENQIKGIDLTTVFCYTNITFPPIFRDGVRGGLAASAV